MLAHIRGQNSAEILNLVAVHFAFFSSPHRLLYRGILTNFISITAESAVFGV